ncbi:hypothetical protein G7046_g1580 [Stylonectria norvegica]|nr:hypothetical protein G7046_g1580 [Stylonectria norvegica]
MGITRGGRLYGEEAIMAALTASAHALAQAASARSVSATSALQDFNSLTTETPLSKSVVSTLAATSSVPTAPDNILKLKTAWVEITVAPFAAKDLIAITATMSPHGASWQTLMGTTLNDYEIFHRSFRKLFEAF